MPTQPQKNCSSTWVIQKIAGTYNMSFDYYHFKYNWYFGASLIWNKQVSSEGSDKCRYKFIILRQAKLKHYICVSSVLTLITFINLPASVKTEKLKNLLFTSLITQREIRNLSWAASRRLREWFQHLAGLNYSFSHFSIYLTQICKLKAANCHINKLYVGPPAWLLDAVG